MLRHNAKKLLDRFDRTMSSEEAAKHLMLTPWLILHNLEEDIRKVEGLAADLGSWLGVLEDLDRDLLRIMDTIKNSAVTAKVAVAQGRVAGLRVFLTKLKEAL